MHLMIFILWSYHHLMSKPFITHSSYDELSKEALNTENGHQLDWLRMPITISLQYVADIIMLSVSVLTPLEDSRIVEGRHICRPLGLAGSMSFSEVVYQPTVLPGGASQWSWKVHLDRLHWPTTGFTISFMLFLPTLHILQSPGSGTEMAGKLLLFASDHITLVDSTQADLLS